MKRRPKFPIGLYLCIQTKCYHIISLHSCIMSSNPNYRTFVDLYIIFNLILADMSNIFVRSKIVYKCHQLDDNPFPVKICCLAEYLLFTYDTISLIEELEAMALRPGSGYSIL